jgi:hypothetical protein
MKLLAISTLLSMASAVFGPITLFNSLASRTLSSNGYEFKPYMEVKKDSVSLGVFNDYVVQDGVYSHHLYSGGSTQEGCVEANSLKLFIVCGNTEFIGPVSFSQPCKYQALLQTPSACGVDFSVGDELVALTPSARPSGNSTAGVIIASSSSSTAALALGALGVSGAMVVIIMQIVKAVRTKGGLSSLLKGNMGKVNGALNNAMKNVPLSDEMKKNITSMVDKQAESLVGKLDTVLDQKLQGVRTETGEGNDLEAAKNLINIITKKAPVEQPEIVVATELPSIPEAEETENKN